MNVRPSASVGIVRDGARTARSCATAGRRTAWHVQPFIRRYASNPKLGCTVAHSVGRWRYLEHGCVLVAAAVGHVPRRRKPFARRQRDSKLFVHAVVLDSHHTSAVSQWIKSCVIDLHICPWAKPAEDAGRVRIVTSSSTSEIGVLEDLIVEAEQLPEYSSMEPPLGIATTTVVVCPYVAAWSDFDVFNDFYMKELDSGEALASSHNLSVVAFHPDFSAYSLELQAGQRIAVETTADGEVYGTMLAEDQSLRSKDKRMIWFRFDDGRERLVELPAEPADLPGPHGKCEWANMSFRAPRPCLHLLRRGDLCQVSGGEDDMLARRETCEQRMRQVGARAVRILLGSCG